MNFDNDYIPPGWEEAEKAVNDYLDSASPFSWELSSYALDLEATMVENYTSPFDGKKE